MLYLLNRSKSFGFRVELFAYWVREGNKFIDRSDQNTISVTMDTGLCAFRGEGAEILYNRKLK